MEAKEKITKLSDNIGIIGAYDYERHKEWEWKQKAKEYVKDDLLKIEEGKKFIEENSKILEEKSKDLEEKSKGLEEKSKTLEERQKSFEEQLVSTAKKLLDKDFSLEDINEITGLSIEKIDSLK